MDLYRAFYYIQHLTLSPLAAAGVFTVTVLLLVLVIRFLFFRTHPRKYIRVFSAAYEEKDSVLYALEQVKEAYPKRSKERAIINSAILHLTSRSILRDYPTAFRIVESVIGSKKVKALHRDVLENEKSKKNQILMLAGPKNHTDTLSHPDESIG